MRVKFGGAALLVLLTASAAYAQDGQSNEIIVTAQKREQSAQSISVAVSVFSGQELVEQGVTNINGLEHLAPSLEVESQFGSGQPSFSLRGVGFKDYATLNAPTVGVYVDEVANPYPVMTQGVLFDLERVEVLRGPQGTLYGRNTTGGAINVLSARPTDDFATGFNAEYGNYDAFRAEGFISGPLATGLTARLSAVTAQGGAWQDNRETGEELGDADRFAVRAQVAWQATPSLDFLLNLHGYQDQSDGLGQRLFKTTAAGAAHAQDQTSWGASSVFAANAGISEFEKPFRDNDGMGASLTANWDFGPHTLTYIGSLEELDRREYNDFDGVGVTTPLPDNSAGVAGTLFDSEIHVAQHELRLASNGDADFDWIVGVYYDREKLNELYQSDFAASFGPAFGYVFTPYSQKVETAALFGQIDYQVSPRVNLIAGLRYENETRDLIGLGTFAVGFPGFNFANGTADGTRESRSLDTDEVSGRLGVEFQVTDDVLTYATISRGVKSGGFSGYNTLNERAIDPFDPEQLTAYEAGVKSDLMDRTLRVNAAVFYYDYKDQQVQSALFDPNIGAAIGRIVNAPKSRIYGAEVELEWHPLPELAIAQALGYQNGEFEEFTILDIAASNNAGAPVGRDASGERLGPAEFTYSGAITYDGAFAGDWGYTAGLDYSYRSDTDPPLLKPVAGEGYGVDGYWLVNANVAVRPNDGPWEFALWSRNLLDEEYDETRNFFAGADFSPIAAPGLPRTYGVRISWRR
jgi:outer membrane receptor protein involved in Fe transport